MSYTCPACSLTHQKGRCPPRPGNRAARKRAERMKDEGPTVPARGRPIEGIHKRPASAAKTGRKSVR